MRCKKPHKTSKNNNEMKETLTGKVLTKKDGSFKAYQYSFNGKVIRTGKRFYQTAFIYGRNQDELAAQRKANGEWYCGQFVWTFGKTPTWSKHWEYEKFVIQWEPGVTGDEAKTEVDEYADGYDYCDTNGIAGYNTGGTP